MISLIILAAGLSTRFPGNKLLSKMGGVPIISKLVKESVNSNADEVLVVVGNDSKRISDAVQGMPCKLIHNSEYLEGQSSSVKCGVKAASSADAIVILPGDVALIGRKEINQVIDGYRKSGNLIVVSSYGGRSGHPILFGCKLFSEILSISEESQGLKSIVKKHESDVLKVQAESINVLIDLDTAADYAKHVSS